MACAIPTAICPIPRSPLPTKITYKRIIETKLTPNTKVSKSNTTPRKKPFTATEITLTHLMDVHKENLLHYQIDLDKDYNQNLVEEDTALLVGKMAVDLVPGYTVVGMDFVGQAVEMVILQNESANLYQVLNFY